MRVQCTVCNTIITSSGRPQCCGCENQIVVDDTTFTSKDLANVKVLNTITNVTESGHLSQDQLQWQEQRRKRKVRKLTFEER